MSERLYWIRRKSGRIAFIGIMTALTTLMNLIMVPMPQPLAEYDLSPILIYLSGVMIDPITAGIIIALAQGIGVTIKSINFGWPLVFIPGAMFVRGIEAIIISLICRRKKPTSYNISSYEIVSMIIGVIWETVGFTVADVILFGPGMAFITLFTIVDAIFIPIAIIIVVAIRRSLKIYRFT